MDNHAAEQKTLLPLAGRAYQPSPSRKSFFRRHHQIIESCALALILFLAASQCLVLYGVQHLPYTSLSSELCIFLANLAAGLRLSIAAGLPTATLLFIASPYVVRPERMLATWYLILICYLVGSTLGALLVWV